MENKTKRTKGLSKPGETTGAATASPTTTETPVMEAPTTQAPKAKKTSPKIKQNITETTATLYEAFKNKGPAYMIMTRNVRVHDKETDKVRFASFCPAEPSIWKDEQSPTSKTVPVIFRNGYLTISTSNPTLRQFMEIHPGNKVNGGNQFAVVNKRIEAEDELSKEFEIHEAINLIKETDFNDLLAVALHFKVNIDKKSSEIKYDLLKIAKKQPTQFVQSFDDPMVKTRAILRQADDYQLIKVNKDSVRWFDSNSLIVSVPHGQDPTTILVRFCLTEKGASVLTDIKDQLERLA